MMICDLQIDRSMMERGFSVEAIIGRAFDGWLQLTYCLWIFFIGVVSFSHNNFRTRGFIFSAVGYQLVGLNRVIHCFRSECPNSSL